MWTMGPHLNSLRHSTRLICLPRSMSSSSKTMRPRCETISRSNNNSSFTLRCFKKRSTTLRKKKRNGRQRVPRIKLPSKRNSNFNSRSRWKQSKASSLKCKSSLKGSKSSLMVVSTGVVSARTGLAQTRATQPRSKSCASIILSAAKTQVARVKGVTMLSHTVRVAFTPAAVASRFSKEARSKKA